MLFSLLGALFMSSVNARELRGSTGVKVKRGDNLSELEEDKAARKLGNDGNCKRDIAKLSQNRQNWCAKQCSACDDLSSGNQNCRDRFCNSGIGNSGKGTTGTILRGCNRPRNQLSKKRRTWCQSTCSHCNEDVSFNFKPCSGTGTANGVEGRGCCGVNFQKDNGRRCTCTGSGEEETSGGVCVKTFTRVPGIGARCQGMEFQCGNFT